MTLSAVLHCNEDPSATIVQKPSFKESTHCLPPLLSQNHSVCVHCSIVPSHPKFIPQKLLHPLLYRYAYQQGRQRLT